MLALFDVWRVESVRGRSVISFNKLGNEIGLFKEITIAALDKVMSQVWSNENINTALVKDAVHVDILEAKLMAGPKDGGVSLIADSLHFGSLVELLGTSLSKSLLL